MSWEHHAASVVLVGASHAVAARIVTESSVRGSRVQSTRWFLLHAVVNAIIAVATFPAVTMSLELPGGHCSPAYGGILESSKFAIVIALWLHLWHCLFFKLNLSEFVHHLFFVTLLGIPGAVYEWGICGNAQLFFICGAPGALMYALLVAKSMGVADSINEPLISAILTIGIRAPGVLYAQRLLWRSRDAARLSAASPPPFWIYVQLSLGVFNALYYSYDALRRVCRSPRKTVEVPFEGCAVRKAE